MYFFAGNLDLAYSGRFLRLAQLLILLQAHVAQPHTRSFKAPLQRFVSATCPMKFNIPQIGVVRLQKYQFTRGDMSPQHIPGTCTHNNFMCGMSM